MQSTECFLLDYINYQWRLCGALKVISIFMGMHIGVAKYCCILCLWDDHSRCYCG